MKKWSKNLLYGVVGLALSRSLPRSFARPPSLSIFPLFCFNFWLQFGNCYANVYKFYMMINATTTAQQAETTTLQLKQIPLQTIKVSFLCVEVLFYVFRYCCSHLMERTYRINIIISNGKWEKGRKLDSINHLAVTNLISTSQTCECWRSDCACMSISHEMHIVDQKML